MAQKESPFQKTQQYNFTFFDALNDTLYIDYKKAKRNYYNNLKSDNPNEEYLKNISFTREVKFELVSSIRVIQVNYYYDY